MYNYNISIHKDMSLLTMLGSNRVCNCGILYAKTSVSHLLYSPWPGSLLWVGNICFGFSRPGKLLLAQSKGHWSFSIWKK